MHTEKVTQKPKIESHWLDQATMAAALEISLSAFQKWRVDPVARIGRKVYYEVSTVIANRQEHQARQLEQRPKPETPEDADLAQRQAKIGLTRAQAEGQELKNAQIRAELAPVKLIEWVIDQAGKGIARHLAGIPAAVKRSCSKLRPSDMKILQAEIVKAQRAAADMSVDLDQYYNAVD